MSDPVVEPIEFTLNGRLYVLARAVVEGRLEGVEPRAIREHGGSRERGVVPGPTGLGGRARDP
jgi:hypothetical protein